MKAIIIYQARQIGMIQPVAAWVRAERGQKKKAFVSLKFEKKSTIVRLFHAAYDFHCCTSGKKKTSEKMTIKKKVGESREKKKPEYPPIQNVKYLSGTSAAASPLTAASWKKHKSGSFDTMHARL